MNAKNLAAGVAALGLALMVAGCGSSSSGASGSSGEIHVLDITGTSGSTAIFGVPETNAMKAAAAYYNAHGGILGKKVVIDVVNDNSDSSTAVSLLTKELSQHPNKYTMIWAGQEGSTSAALTPLLKRYKVFATAVNDGNSTCRVASACPNFFPQAGTNDYAEQVDTEFLKSKGYKKLGVLANEATFTQSELGYLKKDLDQAGINYEVVTFPDTAVNVTPEMTKLKNDGVDSVMALALGPTAGYTLKAKQSLNWDVPLLFDITGSAGDLSSLVPASALQNVSETVQWCMNSENQIPALDLLNKYTPAPIPGNVICSIPGDGWGGIVLLAEAAKKANSLDPAKLIAAANELKITKNEISSSEKCWTKENHDDPCQNTNYFKVVPAGQLKNGRLYPLPG